MRHKQALLELLWSSGIDARREHSEKNEVWEKGTGKQLYGSSAARRRGVARSKARWCVDWDRVDSLVGQQGTGRAGKERLFRASHRSHLGRINSIELSLLWKLARCPAVERPASLISRTCVRTSSLTLFVSPRTLAAASSDSDGESHMLRLSVAISFPTKDPEHKRQCYRTACESRGLHLYDLVAGHLGVRYRRTGAGRTPKDRLYWTLRVPNLVLRPLMSMVAPIVEWGWLAYRCRSGESSALAPVTHDGLGLLLRRPQALRRSCILPPPSKVL